MSLVRGYQPSPRYQDPVLRMTFARLVTHYWANAAWLPDGQLIRDASRLAGIPAVLAHGRLDVSSPLDTAWALANAWPGSRLTVVEDAGHNAGDPTIVDTVLAATNRFART